MPKKKSLSQWLGATTASSLSCNQGVQHWYTSTAGQQAEEAVRRNTIAMSNDVFGYFALQVGDLAGKFDLLANSRVGSHFNIATSNSEELASVDLVADADALPIEFDNIDLIVASHVLDCADSPHQVLREIERVLVPEGHCILIGFNPMSWRGITLFWRRVLKRQAVPIAYSKFRIKDWFTVLGFEVLETQSVGFRSRLSEKSVFKRMRLLNWVISKYCQWFGNVQLIHVRKKVSRQVPIKPRLHAKPILKPGMAVNGSSVGKSLKHKHEQDSQEI